MKNTNKLLLLLSCGMLLAACGNNDASSSKATGLTSESSHATGLTSESSHATGLTSEQSSHATGLTSEDSHDTGLTSEDSHDTGFTSEDSHDTGLTSESSSAVEPSKPYHTWQVVGSVDELGKWGFDNALNFVYDAALDAHVVSEVTLYKGTEFKFVRDKTWSGDNEVVDAIIAALNDAAVVGKSGNNVLVKTSGKFSFKILDKDAAITADDLAITFEEVVDPVVKPAHHWAVIGGFNNWNVNDTTLAFTYDEVTDVHTFTGSIPVNTKFKILADKTWGAMNELGWQVVSALNDTSILHEVGDDRGAEFLKKGTVTITIKDTIDPTSSESYKDVTVDFKEDVSRPFHKWYMIGSLAELGVWDTNGAKEFTFDAATNTHSISMELPKESKFKLIADRAWNNVLAAEVVNKLNDETALTLTGQNGDPTVMKNGVFTISISDDILTMENKLEGLTVSFKEVEVAYTHVWSVVGNTAAFGNWTSEKGAMFTYDEATDTHKVDVEVFPNNEFQILADRAWNIRIIDPIVEKLNNPEALIATGGEYNNIKALAHGTLHIEIKDKIDLTKPLESLAVTFQAIEDTYKSLYFVDKAWWAADNATTRAYIFGDNGEAASWPGVAMTKVGTMNGDNVWSVSVNVSVYGKIVFTRAGTDGAYWDARTEDLVIADNTNDNPMYVLSNEAAWGQNNAAVTLGNYSEESLDPVASTKPLPILAQGNSASRVEGAGVMINLDNTNLGINGDNALSIIADTQIQYAIVCEAHQEFFDADDFNLGTVRQFDDYGANTVRFYFTFTKGFAPDWEYTLTVTITTKIGGEDYMGVARFVNGAFTPAD